MKIRNRIADIKTLQAHILQDYLRMVFEVNFIDDTWKTKFYDVVKKNKESRYSKSYIGAWHKIQLKGMENYSVDDMDTTILVAILKAPGKEPFGCCKFNNINQYLNNLREDRNIDAHMTGNETNSELLQWAYGSLYNINRFIDAVAKAKVSKVPFNTKNSYTRKYQVEIETLRLNFENDYKETLEEEKIEQSIKCDIERIKNSRDPHRTYMEIERQYFNKRDNEGDIDFILYYRFMKTAADTGVVWSCSGVGDFYFNGLLTDVDYFNAAKYYEKGLNLLTPPQKLNLASLYINNLGSFSHDKDEGLEILKSCKSPRWEIITYITKEGYEFYTRRRIKNNT